MAKPHPQAFNPGILLWGDGKYKVFSKMPKYPGWEDRYRKNKSREFHYGGYSDRLHAQFTCTLTRRKKFSEQFFAYHRLPSPKIFTGKEKVKIKGKLSPKKNWNNIFRTSSTILNCSVKLFSYFLILRSLPYFLSLS